MWVTPLSQLSRATASAKGSVANASNGAGRLRRPRGRCRGVHRGAVVGEGGCQRLVVEVRAWQPR